MSEIDLLTSYLARYFVPAKELADLAAVSPARLDQLVSAGAVPRPSYTTWANGAFASPIGGAGGPAPGGPPTHWYALSAAWWIRRAGQLAPADAATRFEARFVAEFVKLLEQEPDAILGYPQAFPAGRLEATAAEAAARAEWRDWLSGAYGVCLRQGDARHAIVKTCRRAAILALTDEGRAPSLTEDVRDRLLTVMAELDSVMLPFAPHQRPQGTPGLWLDAMLARYGLGRMREGAMAATRPAMLCA